MSLGLDQGNSTHLKAAINEAHVRAGEIEASLNLSDGTLHVGACQGLGEVGEGECYNEHLGNTKQRNTMGAATDL